MSDLTNIIKKELRELLTPGSVMSVIVMVVLFVGLGGLVGGEIEKASALPVVGIANSDDSTVEFEDGTWNVYTILHDAYVNSGVPESEISGYIIEVTVEPGQSIYDAMTAKGVSSMIMVDPSFGENVAHNMEVTDPADLKPAVIWEYYIFEPTGMFGTMSSTTVTSIVKSLNSSLSAAMLSRGIGDQGCYSFFMNPIQHGNDYLNTIVDGDEHAGITPQDISNQISSQTTMIPIIIMIIIMMVGSIVISSMGAEKENKTLETLLTLPIRRTTIVTGKIIAAAIVGLVYGLAYMVGLSFYMSAMMDPVGSGVNLTELGMSIGVADWLLIMVSMFLSIICALGICMILGAFAKNYKSAQTMTLPLSILAMIPMFIVMFSGWYGAGSLVKAITFIIPFSHPMMAMQSLMYGDVTLVLAGIAYMLVFALSTILITVKLYNSDILITGLGQNKYVQKLLGRE